MGVPFGPAWIGPATSYAGAATLASPVQRQLAVTPAAANRAGIASGLVARGARNFLIPFLPDVGAAPLYALAPARRTVASGLPSAFTALLGTGVRGLDALPGVNAFGLTLVNLLTTIRIDAAQGGPRDGMTNTTTPSCPVAPDLGELQQGAVRGRATSDVGRGAADLRRGV
jgi:phospholipase/lecithinase/hemolysin